MAAWLSEEAVFDLLFDDNFGLSEVESSEDENEGERSNIFVFVGMQTIEEDEVKALGSLVTSNEVAFSSSEVSKSSSEEEEEEAQPS